VTLQFPKYVSGTGTLHGPVDYQVRNHPGKAALQGTIALSGNTSTAALTAYIDETDSDPITAVDTGSLAEMTTRIFDEAGTKLEEERRYFTIPASGAGSASANYDPTLYGYDDSGQRTRIKQAHGTIYRTAYDLRGQVTGSWIGTNDSSFAGGEASGTDNMVVCSARWAAYYNRHMHRYVICMDYGC
jgi:YD repeat-containing protein